MHGQSNRALDVERAGLQIIYRGLCEGLAVMPTDCPTAQSFGPLAPAIGERLRELLAAIDRTER